MNTLHILAVDQRPWLTNALFGHTGKASPKERGICAEIKHATLDGLIQANQSGRVPSPAILVDPELGTGVPERAAAHGVPLILPIEKAGLKLYETEPGNLINYLSHYTPEYAKVLVRYNPADPEADRAEQRSRLAQASKDSRSAGCKFLFELLVPPTKEQLRTVYGDLQRYEAELRPELTREAMAEIHSDVDIDIWKLEHQGTLESAKKTVALADSQSTGCVLLGAGADIETVTSWLSIAAQAGFIGFAIGRSIWWQAAQYLTKSVSDPTVMARARTRIASSYLGFVDTFESAKRE